MSDINNDIDKAILSILDCWESGKKCLIILGAGASVNAKIPKMGDIYKSLADQVKSISRPKKLKSATKTDSFDMLNELENRLYALSKDDVSRSIAAMSLGTLQRAYEKKNIGYPYENLTEVWNNFSEKFIAGEIEINSIKSETPIIESDTFERIQKMLLKHEIFTFKQLSGISAENSKIRRTDGPLLYRDPTSTHMLVATLAKLNLAHIVSVNFDGLTRKAIDDTECKGVVLSDPDVVERYFLSKNNSDQKNNKNNNDIEKKMIPIIKVWGDLFHAVCRNDGCPESNIRIPIFNLSETYSNKCEVCDSTRQLQIFFTGYEEKEKSTQDLMRVLIKYLAPQIGNIITIGFSGRWDQSLIEFIRLLGSEIEQETKTLGNNKRIPCICIDPNTPSFLNEMIKQKITTLHLQLTGDDFVKLFNAPRIDEAKLPLMDEPYLPIINKMQSHHQVLKKYPKGPKHIILSDNDKMWYKWICGKRRCLPGTYSVLAKKNGKYLENFECLRQLGIKTRISLVIAQQDKKLTESKIDDLEREHNRLEHSRGAAHLSIPWFRYLIERMPKTIKPSEYEIERLATIVLFASSHHDIGHLPFTHLAEEIFEEVHWTLKEWGKPFMHDDPVLGTPYSGFVSDISDTFDKAATLIGLNPYMFKNRVESAIQGCSGFTWIDAILNSPLDVDKLDYIFRDCEYLDQGLHIARRNKTAWIDELLSNTRVLPNGLVALEKISGEHARNFLEERMWLYKHQYNQPAFRCVERIARAVIIQWLLSKVPNYISSENKTKSAMNIIGDTSKLKGFAARELLWEHLKKVAKLGGGEPKLLQSIVEELKNNPDKKIPMNNLFFEWLTRCEEIFKKCFEWSPNIKYKNLSDLLLKDVGITYSDSFYVNYRHLKIVREIARTIETQHSFRALIDIAIFPSFLSYPSHRKHDWHKETIISECFVVSHYDPDKWGQSTNKWIPMSESLFSKKDKERNIKILVVSPYPNDPEVWYTVDRFRNSCRLKGIDVLDVDNSCQ